MKEEQKYIKKIKIKKQQILKMKMKKISKMTIMK